MGGRLFHVLGLFPDIISSTFFEYKLSTQVSEAKEFHQVQRVLPKVTRIESENS